MQEDKAAPALFTSIATNSNESSILRINPATGEVTRVAHINRGAVPSGFVDSSAASPGAWESSGILDVSHLFGEPAGSLFLADIQAHGVTTDPSNTGAALRDSQLVVIRAPGATAHPAADIDTLISIENANGTAFNDTLAGDASANILRGLGGADRLYGGGGNDRLDGGAGIDLIVGGAGSDTFYVDSTTDAVSESDAAIATGGNDLVVSTATYTLSANVERLALSGAALINGTGNALANVIAGNNSGNTLRGLGGNDTLTGGGGNDWLAGGAGQDSFVFNAALVPANRDGITDFNAADDTIRLAKTVFAALGSATGALSAAQFFAGSSAHDGDDRIIYNAATGQIFYDADGNTAGGLAAVLFATLTNKPAAVSETDFVVV